MKRFVFPALGLVAALPAMALPALAGPRDDVLYGITRCGGIADDRVWLDCVYGAAQPMRSKLGLPPAPASQQALVPPPVPGQTGPAMAMAQPAHPAMSEQEQKDYDEFTHLTAVPRAFLRLAMPKEEVAEDATTLKSYKFDAAGYFTVTLANGETWRQSASDTIYAHWNKPAGSYSAQILPSSQETGRRLKVGGQTFFVDKL